MTFDLKIDIEMFKKCWQRKAEQMSYSCLFVMPFCEFCRWIAKLFSVNEWWITGWSIPSYRNGDINFLIFFGPETIASSFVLVLSSSLVLAIFKSKFLCFLSLHLCPSTKRHLPKFAFLWIYMFQIRFCGLIISNEILLVFQEINYEMFCMFQ